jgi:Do/DeqQ family serine protease
MPTTQRRWPRLCVAATILVALAGPALAQGATPAVPPTRPVLAGDSTIADVAERVAPSVVSVASKRPVKRGPFFFDPFFNDPRSPFRNGPGVERYAEGLGSGVIVSPKGYVLTNNHVVADAREMTVTLHDGRQMSARLVGADPSSDLAVLKLEGKLENLSVARFGDSGAMRLGDVVLAIGNPFGVGQTVTMGIVSAKGRADMGIIDYEDFIQTDAAINPGNSGGALVNLRGELIGINTAILSRTGGYQGVGFAIPSNIAEPIMQTLIQGGRVARGYLGVQVQTADRDLAQALGIGTEGGAVVSEVVGASPAARVGLRRGDVLTQVNGRRVRSARELRSAVALAGAGKTVDVEYLRDGKRYTVRLTLDKLKEEAPAPAGTGTPAEDKDGQSRLGVRVAPLDPAARQRHQIASSVQTGVVVVEVAAGSTAEAAGLSPGDVIIEVDRKPVGSPEEFRRLYGKTGKRVLLLVHRGGSTIYLTFTR